MSYFIPKVLKCGTSSNFGKLYINVVSISAEKHFFSFLSTVGASAISFLNKL